MSLISDALRKARQEVAERDARARGVVPPPGPVATRSSASLDTGLILGAVIAAVAALAGGAAVWWWVGSGGDPDPVRVAQAATVPPPTSRQPTGAAPNEDAPDEIAPVEAGLEREGPASGSAAPPAVPDSAPAAATPSPTPPPRTPVPQHAPKDPAPKEPDAAATAADEGSGRREFGLVAELGYARLELGWLIHRSDDPFAEVNGREVHVGSHVDGFVVEEITRTSIRLSDERGPVVLRIR